MDQIFKLFVITILSLGISAAAMAGGVSGSSTTGGGTLAKYIETINQQTDRRIIVVDDSSFIDFIGMLSEKRNELTLKYKVEFNGLVLKEGVSFVSAYRNNDMKNIYLVSESQYKKFIPNTQLDILADHLDFDADLFKLTP